MSKREKLPDDLKELCSLCRAGKLFAVQQWFRDGRPYRMPPGNFATSPIRTAIDSGFHSLAEVLLQEGAVDQEEKNDALIRAIDSRNFDLVELLTQYGADPRTVDFDTVLWSRHPQIMRWFVANGLDLESGYPIANAFRYKHREFLGVYMSVRDTVPTARRQATMALRYHAADGNLKWVSLLLWTGADPRLPVPRLEDSDVDEDDVETALVAAVRRGQFDVVRKSELIRLEMMSPRLPMSIVFVRIRSLPKCLLPSEQMCEIKPVKTARCIGLFQHSNGVWTRRSAAIPDATMRCVA
jgi:hypothetical protein